MRFSFVIPAHNEENYIEETLQYLLAIEYPRDNYEIIVIENGSTDATMERINAVTKTSNGLITVSTSLKGVSKARNKGASMIHPQTDWIIFLDADTVIKKTFLTEFELFLTNKKNVVIGTTRMLPYKNTSWYTKVWFSLYDIGHRITKTSCSIQICKKEALQHISYNEELTLAEDSQFIRDALAFGDFFFFPTNTVLTSTRRYQQIGYWKLFFYWITFGGLPLWLRKKITYKVVR